MTIPSTNISVVNASGATLQVPAAAIPGGALAAGYVQVDPVSGHASNTHPLGNGEYGGVAAHGATRYIKSTVNSFSNNISSNVAVVGQWESAPSHRFLSLCFSSSAATAIITIEQSIDSEGSKPLPPINIPVNQAANVTIPLNGNFFRVSVKNTSAGMSSFSVDSQLASGLLPIDGNGCVPVSQNSMVKKSAEDRAFLVRPSSIAIGTGVALTTATRTTHDPTQCAIAIVNSSDTESYSVDRLQLISTVAGAGLTALDAYFEVDALSRYVSSTVPMSPWSSIAGQGNVFLAVYGNATLTTYSTPAPVGRLRMRAGIPVIGDMFKVVFGDAFTSNGLLSGTVASSFAHEAPPFIIPPKRVGLIHLWGAGMTTAPQFEPQLLISRM